MMQDLIEAAEAIEAKHCGCLSENFDQLAEEQISQDGSGFSPVNYCITAWSSLSVHTRFQAMNPRDAMREDLLHHKGGTDCPGQLQ